MNELSCAVSNPWQDEMLNVSLSIYIFNPLASRADYIESVKKLVFNELRLSLLPIYHHIAS